MRQVGTLPNAELAGRLIDYLLTQGITSKVDAPRPADPAPSSASNAATSGANIWIHDENQVDRAKALVREFLLSPDDARYRQAQDVAVKLRREDQRWRRQAALNVVEMRERWSPGRRPVTMALLATCALVFLIMQRPTESFNIQDWLLMCSPRTMFAHNGATLDDIAKGQVWRLITPIFLHFGAAHLVMNMMALYSLGNFVEMRRGPLWLIVFVLFVGVLSNLGELYWSHAAFGGMSGVLFGLMGYVFMQSRFHPTEGFHVDPQSFLLPGLFFLLCFTGSLGPIANTAHTVGLVAGLTLGYVGQGPWRRITA